jgi:RNAse (barnase) inhibitor barstar
VSEGRRAWPAGGVHRVLGPAASVAAELAGRGWDVAVVPPSRTDAELWDGLVDVLGLPGWFGRNLDALDEALGDLERPTAVVLAGWSTYARARPERWTGLLHVLRDRAHDPERPFVVLLTD